MATGIALNRPVKIPLGRHTSINAPTGTKVEITDWNLDEKNCHKVKIVLWVGGLPITYEGLLNITLLDMDWNIIEKRFRNKIKKNNT